MYESILLFLIIFFGIFGAVKAASLMYTFVVKKVIYVIFRKEDDDVKIWMRN